MKNFLTLIFLISHLGIYAQTLLLNEGFENWPGQGWSTYTLGAGNGWIQSWQSPAVAAHSGNHSAYSSINNSTCNNWLVSPPVYVSNGAYELKFWEKFDDIQYYVNSKVWISDGSSNPSSGNFQILFQNTDTSTNWIQRTIDLSAYQGDTVYIAFQYVGTWHIWFVDDIFIGPTSFTDGELTRFVNPTGITPDPGLEDIIVTLKNSGTTIIDTAIVNWNVNGLVQVPYQKNNLNLLPGDSASLTLSSYFFSIEDEYHIQANLTVPDDFYNTNNQVNGVYTISSSKDGELLGVSPESYYPYTGFQDVKAIIKNLGINIIDSVKVEWSVNGVSQPVFETSGLNLIQGDTTILSLGNYNFPKGVHELFVDLKVIGDTNAVNNSYFSYAAIDTFWESFEGRKFVPENWNFNFAVRDGWAFGIPAHGDYYYSALPDSNFFGVVSDTLYTPFLSINPGDSLRFLIETSAFLAANHRIVAQDAVTGAVQVLQNINVPSGNWQPVAVDLTPATGIKRIGIVASSQNPGHSKYDLITSDAQPFIPLKDLAVQGADIYFLARDGQVESFQCLVKNQGSLAVNGGDYTLKLMEEPGNQLASISGVIIDPWEKKVFNIPFTFSNIGNHKLYFEIEYSQDSILSNNTSRKTDVYVVPAPTIVKSIGQNDYPSLTAPFNSNGNTNSLGEDDLTQTIYLKEDLSVSGDIYGIVYPYDNLLETSIYKYIPLKVWIVQTDTQDLSNGWISPGQLTLVYDDTMEILPGKDREMYIPFSQPVTFTGINNIAIQAYAYDPVWPPSILRFYGTSMPFPGPVRTIGVADFYALNPASPPSGYYELQDFTQTDFVINPISDSGQISGFVYDTAGVPLSGATVSVGNINVSTTTNSTGQYVLPYLPYSNYSVTASSFGYFDSTSQISIDSIAINRDFFLGKRNQVSLAVTVTGSNAPDIPLENVKVKAEGYSTDSTYTNIAGNATLGNIFEGANYEVTLSLYGYFDSTFIVWANNTQISLDTTVINEEFISPFDVYAVDNGIQTQVFWKSPKKSQKVMLKYDKGECSVSYTNDPMENVWLGNAFPVSDTTTITSIEFHTDVYNLATDSVRIDVFDHNEEWIASSESFLIYPDSTMVIDIPNIVVYDTIYAMLHWENNDSSTHALCLDFSDLSIQNTAIIRYPNQPIVYLKDFFGGNAPDMSFHLRVNTLDDDSPFTNVENTAYNLYRGLAKDFPDITNWKKINSSPVTGQSFTDATWTTDDSSTTYRYSVEALYQEGNSMVTFSNVLNWENTVDINEIVEDIDQFRVFPIPAKESFTLELELRRIKDVSVALYDMNGKIISRFFADKAKSLALTKDISTIPSGVYLLVLTIDNQTINERIVISR